MTTFPLIVSPATGTPTRSGRPRARSRLALRLRVAARHDSLDMTLALGVDPRNRPELALRASQLERMCHRDALARTLRRVVAEAATPRATVRGRPVSVRSDHVRADADELIALADRLAFPQPATSVAGIVIARRLVTDGLSSPLYVACAPHTLRRLALRALAELGPMD